MAPIQYLKGLTNLYFAIFSEDNEGIVFPDYLGNFPRLKKLRLGRNQISVDPSGLLGLSLIPDSIGNLKNLESLAVNMLPGLKELPDSIGDLCSLTELRIDSCCSLEGLPESIGRLKALKFLEVTTCTISNRFQYLPDCIGDLTKLQTLRISAGHPDFKFPSSLGRLRHLEVFSITCPDLTELPECMGELKALKSVAFWSCTRLETLSESFVDLLEKKANGEESKMKHIQINSCPNLVLSPKINRILSAFRSQGVEVDLK